MNENDRNPLLQILALMREGQWNEAHNLVQRDDSSAAAWLRPATTIRGLFLTGQARRRADKDRNDRAFGPARSLQGA